MVVCAVVIMWCPILKTHLIAVIYLYNNMLTIGLEWSTRVCVCAVHLMIEVGLKSIFTLGVDKVKKHCTMGTHTNQHTHKVIKMIIITKATFEQYINALNHARDTDERIKTSLSTPDELRAKATNHYMVQTEYMGRIMGAKEFYTEHLQVRVAYQGTEPVAGYLVVGGELVGLFSTVRGKGDWLMQHAVSDGANLLDCFAEPALLKLYHRHGFTITRSEANWDPAGLPVVYMNR